MSEIGGSDSRIFPKLFRHVLWESIDTLLPSATTLSIVLTAPQRICSALLTELWPPWAGYGSRTLTSTRWGAKLLEDLVDNGRVHNLGYQRSVVLR